MVFLYGWRIYDDFAEWFVPIYILLLVCVQWENSDKRCKDAEFSQKIWIVNKTRRSELDEMSVIWVWT